MGRQRVELIVVKLGTCTWWTLVELLEASEIKEHYMVPIFNAQ